MLNQDPIIENNQSSDVLTTKNLAHLKNYGHGTKPLCLLKTKCPLVNRNQTKGSKKLTKEEKYHKANCLL